MKYVLTLLVTVSIVLFSACTQKASPGKAAKRNTNYQADIIPLLQARCSPCHLPTKGGHKADFENYESARKYAADMVTRILRNPGEKGYMPFKGAKLPEEEINVFKKWVEQGMLEK